MISPSEPRVAAPHLRTSSSPSIGIVGGGLVGMATALKILEALPGVRMTLWEKEPVLGQHQSTHNSGVLHAGLYYKPGSLKARLAMEGIRSMTDFCRHHEIKHEICGKLVVAATKEEVVRLRGLHERGRQNGLRGLEWLERERIAEFEPYAAGLAALRVPEEGIVDYAAVCRVMGEELQRQGASVIPNARVSRLIPDSAGWRVTTDQGDYTCDFLINCAGLHCDRIAGMAGEKSDTRIVPFRGEYYALRPERQFLVRNLIYPVPDATFPFLGVHFTRLIHGGIEAGPNAVLAFAREGYNKWNVNPRDLAESLLFPGLWRFLKQHRKMCWEELVRSFSRQSFCQSLQKLVPDIRESDLRSGESGVRAQAMSPAGALLQDFELLERPRALHVLNAPSPAATASLAIGQTIASRVIGCVSRS